MTGTFINVALVLLGSALGLLFKNRISARFAKAITSALGLCVLGIGVSSMIGTQNTLCVILCMVAGTLLGELLNIEKRMDGLGELLRRKLVRGGGNSRFVEGFVTASVLFCVGAMAINGSMEAGMLGKYDILVSKSVIDGVTSITFAAAMGVGVAFSAVPLLIYEGGLTLIFALAGQGMDPAVVTEMSAVGGTIIVGIALNMLGLPKEKIRVGNMLPAIFLPIAYIPAARAIGELTGRILG
ncbi:DUF554 domain-containing protein [Pseudoflavonifractor phocaeensis]|uniref:DUF554 domain-containing protein n=1 Tax=Pseudoflavonifractor phocaeensis TaxID=1870988 RepID=UPI00210D32C1|nr:DUF554 domain-containing protein [Pseudoflavonifractor phocaeensis]MCQ4863567.1 DUF554 domain-containing protein [Pseudoflavonifractor phocaeensis]